MIEFVPSYTLLCCYLNLNLLYFLKLKLNLSLYDNSIEETCLHDLLVILKQITVTDSRVWSIETYNIYHIMTVKNLPGGIKP